MLAPQVLCIGGAHVDLVARCLEPAQLADSNPVALKTSCGGVAHNIAQNLKSLGCAVSMMGMVGDDAEGARVLAELKRARIGLDVFITLQGAQTGCYISALNACGELLVGLAHMGIYEAFLPAQILPHLSIMNQIPLWVIDGNLPQKTVEFLCQSRRDNVKIFAVAVSAAKISRLASSLRYFDGIFLNGVEASALLGCEVKSPQEAMLAAEVLHLRGIDQVFLTLGALGVAFLSGAKRGFFEAPPVKKADVNGAGDAFAAAAIDGLISNLAPEVLMKRALIAAGLAIETSGQSYGMFSQQILREREQKCTTF